MSNAKISIRFFDNREVRAVWDHENAKWWFSVLDIVGILTDQNDYTKTRNYWKYLKTKLKKENSELVSVTTQLKLLANDGKRYLTNMLDYNGIITLGKEFPSKKANRFIEWFTFSAESIDGKSKTKAYALFDSSFISSIEVGTTQGLQQIHAYFLGGLYEFAGQIRQKNISKGGFQFAVSRFLGGTLKQIDAMPENWTVKNLLEKHASRPYNPDIANALFRSGYIESWGRGTIKIVNECKKAGIPEPIFNYDSSDISVEFSKDIYDEKYLQSLNLNERQVKAVLFVKKKGRLTNKEYQEMNHITDRTALRDLETLIELNIIKRKGEKKGAYYELAP